MIRLVPKQRQTTVFDVRQKEKANPNCYSLSKESGNTWHVNICFHTCFPVLLDFHKLMSYMGKHAVKTRCASMYILKVKPVLPLLNLQCGLTIFNNLFPRFVFSVALFAQNNVSLRLPPLIYLRTFFNFCLRLALCSANAVQ